MHAEMEIGTNKKAFQIASDVTSGFERVVQVAHNGDGFEVDRVLIFKFMLLVAGDERELIDVAVKVIEWKLERYLLFEIVKGDFREIAHDDKTGAFIVAALGL